MAEIKNLEMVVDCTVNFKTGHVPFFLNMFIKVFNVWCWFDKKIVQLFSRKKEILNIECIVNYK